MSAVARVNFFVLSIKACTKGAVECVCVGGGGVILGLSFQLDVGQ